MIKEGNMAASMDFPPTFTVRESDHNKANGSTTEAEDASRLNNIKQLNNGKPPRHLSVKRHSISSMGLPGPADLSLDPAIDDSKSADEKREFIPVFRSGSCAERGPKQCMEDEHICIDDLNKHIGSIYDTISPLAFYGVFDGHGGTDAALFVRNNILRFTVEDSNFPVCMEKAIKSAFLKADSAFADASSLDVSSGTTALTVFILGRLMIIANAGDCRAVLGRRGRAVEMSKDHKPNCMYERRRIEKLGGVIYDGYLNGQLSVSRAIGDWHMKGAEGQPCPLSAEPELQEISLTEEDEFLILGCDGLWDVMSSQCAVTMARKELMLHNDPERCSRELVTEALRRNTCDNLTVVLICFSPHPPPQIEIPPSRVRRSISSEGLNLLKGILDSN